MPDQRQKCVDFTDFPLDAESVVAMGSLPAALKPDEAVFDALWQLHPAAPPTIFLHGKMRPIPRWQQAYGRDYQFSGTTSRALPVPRLLSAYLEFAQAEIDARLNGLLLNWYDGAKGHYIGQHRDSVKGLEPDTPIVTMIFGEARPFRFKRWKGTARIDLPGAHGTMIILSQSVNAAWTHGVPKSKRAIGRRISITIRAFVDE